MTHLHLLRVFTYLGLRGSRKNSIAVFPSVVPVLPQSRIQSVDTWSNTWQQHHYTTHDKGDFRYRLFISANRGACCQMGQASSFVRGYGGAGENAGEKSKGGVDKGLKGLDMDDGSVGKIDSAKVPNDTDGSAENEVEQKATEDVLAKVDEAERILEAAVFPEDSLTNELEKNVGKHLLSENEEARRLAKTENVVIEEPVKSQTALNLALDELGEPPERPLPGDCCGQGCDVCVWDTYNDELRDYLIRKKALLKRSE